MTAHHVPEFQIVDITEEAMRPQPRLVEVRQRALRQNDLLARALRAQLFEAGVSTVSIVSAPGSGKTTLLEELLRAFRDTARVAALVGDLATENDAARLERSGVPVKQINTGTICHLDAAMVAEALAGWDLNALDLIFIENVGNLVCPSSYDLGEDLRIVLTAVTEGEDKPLKYPTIFNTADVAVITKMDLASAVEFDLAMARGAIQQVRPGMRVFELSAKTGAGMAPFVEFLGGRLAKDIGRPHVAG